MSCNPRQKLLRQIDYPSYTWFLPSHEEYALPLHPSPTKSIDRFHKWRPILFFNTDRYHFDGPSSSESKEPQSRLLEIEANAVLYIQNLASAAGNPSWSRKRPKLVYCEAWWLRSSQHKDNSIFLWLPFMQSIYIGAFVNVGSILNEETTVEISIA